MANPGPKSKNGRRGRLTVRGKASEQIGTADERLLQRERDSEFVHSDPWRVLRILGEFVDGFDALARVGHCVSVFGSARVGEDDPEYAAAQAVGRGSGRGRPRGDYRRRTRDHGGRQPRGLRGRRHVDRLQHRTAPRAARQRLREPADRLPLLLRPQDDVRQVLRRVRGVPRRLRDDGRAVRSADPDPDRQDARLPTGALRERVLGRPHRLDAHGGWSGRAWSTPKTLP